MKVAIKTCPCGKRIQIRSWLINRKKFCSKICFYKYRTRSRGLNYILKKVNKGWFKKGQKVIGTPFGKNSTPWNKGLGNGYIDIHGYKVLCINGKEFLEHRKIMEDYLKRKLLSTEIVHHIDSNKLNNNIDNLELLTRSEHTTLHMQLKYGL